MKSHVTNKWEDTNEKQTIINNTHGGDIWGC